MDEQKLKKIFQQDLSAGTEKFRDELLSRCLDQLDSADGRLAESGFRVLDDEELDMLAAAGDPFATASPEDKGL